MSERPWCPPYEGKTKTPAGPRNGLGTNAEEHTHTMKTRVWHAVSRPEARWPDKREGGEGAVCTTTAH